MTKLLVACAILVSVVLAIGADGKKSPAPVPTTAAAELRECFGAGRTLASGVHVKVARSSEEEAYGGVFTGMAGEYRRDFSRSADIYGPANLPGILVIHDQMVSNEDSLVLVDFARNDKPQVVEIAHPDNGDYGHVHYSTVQMGVGFLTATEQMWAAVDDKKDLPRHRQVKIWLRPNMGRIEVGPWQHDK